MKGKLALRKVIKIHRSLYVGIPAEWRDIIDEGCQVRLTRHGSAVMVERVE